MKKELPFWLGLTIIIIVAIIAGLVAHKDFDETAQSLGGENFMTITLSTPVVASTTVASTTLNPKDGEALTSYDNGQYSFQYPAELILATTTSGEIDLWGDKSDYAFSHLSTTTRYEQCDADSSDDVPNIICANRNPSLEMDVIYQPFQPYIDQMAEQLTSAQEAGDFAPEIVEAGMNGSEDCVQKNGQHGFMTVLSGEFVNSYACYIPINNSTLHIGWGDSGSYYAQSIIPSISADNVTSPGQK